MKLYMPTAALLLSLSFFPLAANAQRGSTPYDLSCWQGKSFHTRTARTKMFPLDGTSVYGLVTAVANSDSDGAQNCSNRVQLFLSRDGSAYKKVFDVSKEFHGLGVEILGWSPDQKRLLFQIRHWPYDSDFFNEFTAFVLSVPSGHATNVKVSESFTKHFGDKCEFEARVQGWQDDKTLRVLVSRTPETEHYDQVFCVKKPTNYFFDLETQRISKPSN